METKLMASNAELTGGGATGITTDILYPYPPYKECDCEDYCDKCGRRKKVRDPWKRYPWDRGFDIWCHTRHSPTVMY